jgi:hypothetical protein
MFKSRLKEKENTNYQLFDSNSYQLFDPLPPGLHP